MCVCKYEAFVSVDKKGNKKTYIVVNKRKENRPHESYTWFDAPTQTICIENIES